MNHHRDKKIARAYIPAQVYEINYNLTKGLRQGTIFPELDIPY